jgi:hypothetical protein
MHFFYCFLVAFTILLLLEIRGLLGVHSNLLTIRKKIEQLDLGMAKCSRGRWSSSSPPSYEIMSSWNWFVSAPASYESCLNETGLTIRKLGDFFKRSPSDFIGSKTGSYYCYYYMAGNSPTTDDRTLQDQVNARKIVTLQLTSYCERSSPPKDLIPMSEVKQPVCFSHIIL